MQAVCHGLWRSVMTQTEVWAAREPPRPASPSMVSVCLFVLDTQRPHESSQGAAAPGLAFAARLACVRRQQDPCSRRHLKSTPSRYVLRDTGALRVRNASAANGTLHAVQNRFFSIGTLNTVSYPRSESDGSSYPVSFASDVQRIWCEALPRIHFGVYFHLF